MSVNETDKERYTLYLDNAIRHKLQVLAESEEMKLGSFINSKLRDIVEDFERMIFSVFGKEEFLGIYHKIFGAEYSPLITYNFVEETNDEVERKKLISSIKSSLRANGKESIKKSNQIAFDVDLNDLLAEADNKKEPSEE